MSGLDTVVLERGHGGAALGRRLLNFTLFVTVLLSSIAFIEPSPHDVMMVALLVMCVAVRVPFDRKLAALLILLVVWLIGGLAALVQLGDQRNAVQYVATSIYLGIAAMLFACLVGDGDAARLNILRRSYVLAALIATAAGYAGFFHLVPHYTMFLDYGRVSATFKDPNVYGPFLIFPLLLVIIGLLTDGIRLSGLIVAAVLVGGLFLSFSRGAWLHFALSASVALGLIFAVTPNPRMRYRIVLFGIAAGVAATLFLLALASIDSVRALLSVRAQALQPYDVRPGGRFWEQRIALGQILDHPNGLGPFEFSRRFGEQQHDVYMQGFLVYGWLGGAAYLTLVAVTLLIGIRAAIIATPWQIYLIAAYAAFVGEAFEGFIVDTDHWRHFFLLLGLVWGLTAATINARRRRDFAAASPAADMPAASQAA